MRFLLDKNISFRFGSELEAHGHDVVHVDDLSMGDATDPEILERASRDERIIISADTDFGAHLAADRAAGPSVILVRAVSTLPSRELARLLLVNLDGCRSTWRPVPSSQSDVTTCACGGFHCADCSRGPGYR